MHIDNLFKCSEKIRFKVIRSIFEDLAVSDTASKYFDRNERYTNPEQIFNLFSFLKDETKEHFLAVHLDCKNRIVCIDKVSVGSLSQSIVHPREVFKAAMLSSASSIIIVHNHPSGDPTPSREDVEITRRLKEGAEILGIKLLDHIVIGERYISFCESGIL